MSRKTEYTISNGRMDSIGIDENNSPVIFEYKRSQNENVINQGLFYLDWLLDHKADFKLLVIEKLGMEAANSIDWSVRALFALRMISLNMIFMQLIKCKGILNW